MTHTAAGGVYQGVSATLPVTVVDDDSVGLVFSAESLSVAEGATASYTVRLASRPTGAVTVALRSADAGAVTTPVSFSFTTGNWDQARTVTVGGVDDTDADDESVLVTHTASGGGYQGVRATVTVTVVDDESVGLVFSRTALSVAEGDSVSYTVRLASRPTATVTVTLRSGDDRSVSLIEPAPVPPTPTTPARSTLSFTTGDWDLPRTVTVGGVDDDDAADESTTVTHTASGGGYSAVSATVTVTVDDDDTVGLVVSAESLSVAEGATASYTVRLATEPTAAVTVALTSSDVGAVSVLPASLTFTTAKGNWDRDRTITVTGVDDADDVDESTTVTHTASGGDYGALTETLPVTVDDDDAVGLVFSRTALSVTEGATALYTVRLASRPTATVTVTATSGDTGAVSVSVWSSLTFTTTNWDLPRTITVGGVPDADAADESVLVTHTASGGDYGAVSETVTVAVVDDGTAAPGLVFSRTALSVTEGATASYTLRLATQPTGVVTVEVTSGDAGAVSVPASLTFTTGNWDQPRTITVTGVDDADAADESVTVTHTASGGGYGGVSETVTVDVVDAGVPAGLVVSAESLSVDEGATASYTLRLATQPTDAVTVVVTSSDTGAVSVPPSFTFTTGNWNQPRTITVGGVADNNTDDESVTVTHTASGGGYDAVSATVTVAVVDAGVPPGLVVSTDALSVDEGETASYTLRLATRPNGAVTVALTSSDTGAVSVPPSFTFTTGNWEQARPVTVGGVSDGNTADESVTITHTASRGGYGGVSATVNVAVVDDDSAAPRLVFTPESLSVDEGETASYTLRLATRPGGTVTVELTSGDTGAVSVPTQLTFTRQNWNQLRTITVGGVADDDAADESVTVTHTASGGGYGGVSATVTVDVVDDDTVGLVFSAESLSVDEGATESYTVRLATQPTRTVTVALTSSDTGAVSLPLGQVTFTTGNWQTPQTVTVTGVSDDDAVDESVTITHTASRGGYGGVSATVNVAVVDAGVPAGLVISRDALSVDEGETASYTLRLATRPSGAVTVEVTSSDSGAVSVPASLTFTTGNWDQPRTITVGGVSDADDVDESVTVTHTASGGGYGAVSATVTVAVVDDDGAAPGLVVSAESLSVDEGETASYTLRLATQPTDAVTVVVTSSDTGAVSVPPSFTFTTGNWNQPRTITVGGVADNNTDDESVTVTHTASGGGYDAVSATVTVAVVDAGVPPGLVVSTDALSVDEGETASYTLRLATRPNGAVTVALTSSDTGAVSVPPSFTFTTGNWNQARPVTVGGVSDGNTADESVTITHTASRGGYGGVSATVNVAVVDDDSAAPRLVFTPESLSVDEGETASYTLRLATRPGGTVTVELTSGDTGAVSVPTQLTFTRQNWNQLRTITVGGVADDDAADESVTVTHTASGGGYGGVSATVTVDVVDDDTVGLVFSAESLSVEEGVTESYTVRLATQPTRTVTVELTSSDTGAVSLSLGQVMFTTGNWDQPRTITVTGVDDSDAVDELVSVTHTASRGGYGGLSETVSVTVVDDDAVAPGFVFSVESLQVTEGASATYRVWLASPPDVSVLVSLSGSGVSVLPAPLTFTTTNWQTSQLVRVTGVDDDDVDGDESASVTHTAAGGVYQGVSATLPVTVVDDDTVGLVFSADALSVAEGASVSYTVRLATRPTGAVTVTLTSGDTGAVSAPVPASLTFTRQNWDQPRTITVGGVDDDDAVDESVSVTHTASGGGYGAVSATVTVAVVDDESVGLVLSRTSLSVAEGATASYTLRLASQPPSAVTVALMSGNNRLVSVPAPLTFTTGNWDQARTITVGGVDDDDAVDELVTVTHTASGGGYGAVSARVTVAVVDDDTVGLVFSPESLSVAEGATASYTVRLATEPTAAVTVALTSSDTGAVSVLPVSLTFTTGNWNHPVTITVTGVDDADAVDESVTVTHTASGGDYGGVSATVTVDVVDDEDANTAPEFTNSSSVAVAENTSSSDFAFQLAATDHDALDSVTGFSVSGGADQTLFEVNASNELVFTGEPFDLDYAKDTYTVVVTATSGTGTRELTADQTITVSVSDRCAADTTTVCTVPESGSESSRIDVADDRDWFRVELDAINTHEIVVEGGGGSGELADPFVKLYDSSGAEVSPEVSAGDDDDDGIASIKFFTPESDGIYYIEVRDADGTGTGTFTVSFSAQLNGVRQVTAGEEHACALLLDSSITCWGAEFGGLLLAPAGQRFTSVAAGMFHTCAVTIDGSVECWGENSSGQTEPPALSDFVVVRAGFYHSCGLRSNGTVTCWGYDSDGRLDVPPDVSFSVLAAGTFHTCGIDTDQAVVCWGENESGQTLAPSGEFGDIAGGLRRTCGLTTDGRAECWGEAFPTLSTLEGTFMALAASLSNMCGLREDATVACWGNNYHDQNRAPLGQFASLGVSAGRNHCVITAGSDRLVTCWGFYQAVKEQIPAHLAASVVYPASPNTAPYFPGGAELTVMTVLEGEALSHALSATDDDPADNVEMYEIVGGADSASFEVDLTTGLLALASGVVLDYEIKQSYVVVVRVTSGTGSRELTTDLTVTLNVGDVNEAPRFTSADTVAVREDIQTSSFVHQIVAVDDDSGDDIVDYTITGGADAVSFEVDSTGLLTFASTVTLDHESGKTSYEVEVTAASGAGPREVTASQTITVAVEDVEELPTQPGTPTRDDSEANSVSIEWTAPVYAGPPITGYEVQYREVGASVWTDWPHSGSATRAEITGLAADTAYEFQVRAANDDGEGPWSDTLEVTTESADDCHESTATVCSVVAGSSTMGTIDAADDGDWFSVQLQSGTIYQIDVRGDSLTDNGGTLPNPAVAMFDSAGDALSPPVSDDDSGTGNNARVALFAPAASGTYFVEVRDSAGTSTGNYTVEVSVIDTVDLVVSLESLPIAEGNSATYMVSLSAAPRGTVTVAVSAPTTLELDAVSLTFTTENWETPQLVTVTAAQDADAVDEVATISHTASGGGYENVTEDVSVMVDDDETAGVRLSATQLAVTEGEAATYSVRLESQPTETVTVRVRRSGSGVVVLPVTLTFTSGDWSNPKTVTVTGVDDSNAVAETVILTHRSSGGEYDSAGMETVSVAVSDNDVPGVVLNATSLDLSEGGTGTYTVVLQTQPSANVDVAVTRSGSADIVARPATLRFTNFNWDTPQTVTVTGREDDDAGDDAATLAHSATGGGYDSVIIDSVIVAVVDGDTRGVVLNRTSLTLGEGSSAVYSVALGTEPSDSVTVTLTTTGSGDVSVLPTTLTFTTANWEIAQLVTVTAAQDGDTTEDQATVVHSVSGGDYGSVVVGDVAVTVTDGETQGVTITPATLSLSEGSSLTYSVVLTAEPNAQVTVTPSVSGSGDVVVTLSPLTFATGNWSIAQTVTVTGNADEDAQNDTAIVAHALSGGGYDSVTAPDVLVTVVDPVGKPILDAVRAGDQAFQAEWSPVSVRADVTITGYEVQYRPSGGSVWSTAQAAATDASLLVTGVPNNDDYEVQLRATTDAGTSVWSDSHTVTVGRPEPPASLKVVPGHEEFYIDWEAPPNSDLLTRNGNSIYYVVRVARVGATDSLLESITAPMGRTRWRTWETTTDGSVLIDGTEYTVAVFPVALLVVGSVQTGVFGTAAATNAVPAPRTVGEDDPRHQALRDTIEHVIADLETADPASLAWAREAWDFILEQEDSSFAQHAPWNTFGVFLDDMGSGVLAVVGSACTSSAVSMTRTALPWCFSTYMRVDLGHWCGNVPDESTYRGCVEDETASSVDPAALSRQQELKETVVHELGHIYARSVYNVTRDLGKSSVPLGAAWLHALMTGRAQWTLDDDRCASELLADVFAMVTVAGFDGSYVYNCLGITNLAPPQCDHTSLTALCDSVRSMTRGEVPQWYTDRYAGDSDSVWSDIIVATTFGGQRNPGDAELTKINLLQSFEDAFGGYCSAAVGTTAMFGSATAIFNPWVDGGCEPDAVQPVTVTAGTTTGTLDVSWTAPSSVGGAPLTGYRVEWKRDSEPYSTSRSQAVAGNVTSATISVGTGISSAAVRVLAINEIGESTAGEANCTLDANSDWQCTFTPPAPQSRSTRGGDPPQSGSSGTKSTEVPRPVEVIVN